MLALLTETFGANFLLLEALHGFHLCYRFLLNMLSIGTMKSQRPSIRALAKMDGVSNPKSAGCNDH
jgi:hypothetical protein